MSNEELEIIKKLNQKNSKEFMKMIKNFKEENRNYISDGVGNVPTEVLVAMVENLIESTSIKRKFDSNLDSVGGDMDIIIITKGDGLIYKRKIDYTKK